MARRISLLRCYLPFPAFPPLFFALLPPRPLALSPLPTPPTFPLLGTLRPSCGAVRHSSLHHAPLPVALAPPIPDPRDAGAGDAPPRLRGAGRAGLGAVLEAEA